MGICNRCRKSAAQRVDWVGELMRGSAPAFWLRLIIEMDGMKTKTQQKNVREGERKSWF